MDIRGMRMRLGDTQSELRRDIISRVVRFRIGKLGHVSHQNIL